MISICLPTRGRAEAFRRLCVSVLDNTANPDDLEFVVYRDNDDPAVYEYLGNHKEVVGDRIIQSQMYNECYKIATGPIYMFLSDDMFFETKDWDKYVKNAFDQSADKIIFVHLSERHYREKLGTVGFLHKNWIETVGYFLPPYFAAQYADCWINNLADFINRRVFLSEVEITNSRINNDLTHQEYIFRGRQSKSKAIYWSKAAEREKDAQLLQNFINNFNPVRDTTAQEYTKNGEQSIFDGNK